MIIPRTVYITAADAGAKGGSPAQASQIMSTQAGVITPNSAAPDKTPRTYEISPGKIDF